MVTEAQAANERAQEAFHRMLAIYTDLGEWEQASVDAYENAERDYEWEQAKAGFDTLQSADHDMHQVFGVFVTECEDCATDPESRGITAGEFAALVASYTPGELTEVFGR